MIKELEAVREAKKNRDQLWMEYQALIPTPASQAMDGMPKASAGTDRNAAIVDLRDEAEERYKRAEDRYRAAESIARVHMSRIGAPWLYSLCLYYYIGAMKEQQVCAVMHISESTFKRYRADLKKFDPN